MVYAYRSGGGRNLRGACDWVGAQKAFDIADFDIGQIDVELQLAHQADRLERVPLAKALERLLDGNSYALSVDDDRRISTVYLLPPGTAQSDNLTLSLENLGIEGTTAGQLDLNQLQRNIEEMLSNLPAVEQQLSSEPDQVPPQLPLDDILEQLESIKSQLQQTIEQQQVEPGAGKAN